MEMIFNLRGLVRMKLEENYTASFYFSLGERNHFFTTRICLVFSRKKKKSSVDKQSRNEFNFWRKVI